MAYIDMTRISSVQKFAELTLPSGGLDFTLLQEYKYGRKIYGKDTVQKRDNFVSWILQCILTLIIEIAQTVSSTIIKVIIR